VTETIPSEAERIDSRWLLRPSKEALRELQAREQRFQAYLMARGVLLPTGRMDAFVAVGRARRRGQTQSKECFELAEKTLAETQSQCGPRRPPDQWDACYDLWKAQHPPPFACEQQARCLGPDNLPP